jgi:hypothetical protein
MKLGDKVRFQKELFRKGYSYSGSALSDKEAKNMNENGLLPEAYTRYSVYENKKPLTGIVCGKRTIKFKGYSRYIGYEEGYDFVTFEYKQVYLVAVGMSAFRRVPEEFIITE